MSSDDARKDWEEARLQRAQEVHAFLAISAAAKSTRRQSRWNWLMRILYGDGQS